MEEYRKNLRAIVNHPILEPHEPKLLLIITPPVCEYKTQEQDRQKGRTKIGRLAAVTKLYADAALEIAEKNGIPTVNLWGAFMEYAGWREGEPLIGSKEVPRNERLGSLLRDGKPSTRQLGV